MINHALGINLGDKRNYREDLKKMADLGFEYVDFSGDLFCKGDSKLFYEEDFLDNPRIAYSQNGGYYITSLSPADLNSWKAQIK